MRWLKTFSLVIRSNITALFECFENPERVLNQLVIDMEEELERVRANVAAVIADEIVLGKQRQRESAAHQKQHGARAIGAARSTRRPGRSDGAGLRAAR